MFSDMSTSFPPVPLPVSIPEPETADLREDFSEFPFWSDDGELQARLHHRFPRRSSAGRDVDAFVVQHHARQKKPSSWHHHPEQCFLTWKETFLEILRQNLIVPGALGADSNAVLHQTIDHGDFREEHVELTLTPPFRSEAIITIPKNGRKKHPAIVLLHCLGSLTLFGKEKLLFRPGEPSYLTAYRQECYEGRSLLADFAKAGYLCIAIDALGFGKRSKWGAEHRGEFECLRSRLTADEAEDLSLSLVKSELEETARSLGAVGLSIAAITATDDLRTVDYLVSRDDVDVERIGCAGLSFGSFRANYLSALDGRVKATASVCWISTLDGVVGYNLPRSVGFFAIPGQIYKNFDMIDIPIAAAPKAFLAISGWNDVLMEPRGAAAGHLSLRRAWRAAGHPEKLGSLIYKAPHEFNRPMQERALEFFQIHL